MKKFHLITSFPLKKGDRLNEFGTCLRLNLLNKYIDTITIVTDVFKIPSCPFMSKLLSKFEIQINESKKTDSHSIIVQKKWPKYNDLFEQANKHKDKTSIIANGDVFFDDSLRHAQAVDWEQKLFLHITRREASLIHDPIENHLGIHSWKDEVKEHSTNGHVNQFSLLEMNPDNFRGSADAWIFKTPINLFGEDAQIGTSFCDHAISSLAENSGYKVRNPCLDINVNHLHSDFQRHVKAKEEVNYGNHIKIPYLVKQCSIKELT